MMSTNATHMTLTSAIVVILVLLKNEMILVVAASVCPGDMIYDELKTKCVCPTDMYYDPVTRLCTDCYDICNNAALQRTQDECDSLCPDYQLSLSDMPASAEEEEEEEEVAAAECLGDMHYDKEKMKCICAKDMFYDDVTRHCSSCHVICNHAAIQGTEEECNAACPGYHLPFTPMISPVPFLGSTPPQGSDYHKTFVIVAICASVCLLLIVIAMVCCCGATCERRGREMCSLVVSLLPCVSMVRNGAEAEHDQNHERVPLAITRRPPEVFDNQQPLDHEANARLTPSGHTADKADEETKLKTGH